MSVIETKIALCGIGGYGDFYLEALLAPHPPVNFRLVGAVDPVPHRSRRLGELRAAGVPLYGTLHELFNATDVQLIIISAPIHLHASLTCFALQRGANVLCEKPLAGTPSEAMRMAECERRSAGRFVAVGFQWSFSRAVQALKRDVMAGAFGRPIRMRSIAFYPRSVEYFRRNDWVGRVVMPNGGGDVFDSPANNATAHFLHNMFYLLGRTRETSSMPAVVEAELYRANDIENYDTAAIRAVTECGTELLFYTTHAVPDRHGPRCRLEFEHAVVEYDSGAGGEFVARFHDGRVRNYGQPNRDEYEKIWQSINAARTGAPLACGIAAATAHVRCVAAAQQSAGEIVNFASSLKYAATAAVDRNPMVCVRGLAEGLCDCYERGILPAQHGGFEWARRGMLVPAKAPQVTVEPRRRDAVAVVGGEE